LLLRDNNMSVTVQKKCYVANSVRDEYTPFRPLLRSCKKRLAPNTCDIDLEYLKQLWESQNGKCAITGVDLSLKKNYNKNFQASIDRIDNSIGYKKGNIRFTSVSVNWVKNKLDDVHLMEFIEICKTA